MYTVKSTLPEQDLKVVGEALQGALVDLIDLSLIAKQIHWNVVGPRFRSVHLQLDEVVAVARSYTDVVAERSAALGISPDGRAATVAASTEVRAVEAGWQRDSDAVQILVDALGAVAGRMRERIEAVHTPDPVTEDLFLSVTSDLEKHHWMFQAANG